MVYKWSLLLFSQAQLFVNPRLLYPWDFPGKHTGVDCHFFSSGSSQPRDLISVFCPGRWILYHWATWDCNKCLWSNVNRESYIYYHKVKVARSCPTLYNRMDYSPPGSSVHGILQARILEWVTIPFSRGSSPPRGQTQVSCLQVDSSPAEPPGKPYYPKQVVKCVHACMLSHFSHVQLCNPMDCNPLGSSVQGVLQARILEWVAMPSSRGSSQPKDQTHISYSSCIGRWVLYH